MSSGKGRSEVAAKVELHPRSLHRGRYDFAALVQASPELAAFVSVNEYGDPSVDFSNPLAVKALNRALLASFYAIRDWDIPPDYLCPPIPGRADYLHYLADLLAADGGTSARVLDIGTGASCIYPLLGNRIYGWRFAASDIDVAALKNAQRLLDANDMNLCVELRLQQSRQHIFEGVLNAQEHFSLTLCNPPFHASASDAGRGTARKWKNLRGTEDARLNFGGRSAELWCAGGEEAFIGRMIAESAAYAKNCAWFTSLVSKSASLPALYRALKNAGVLEQRTVQMAQGQKISRFIAWSFMDQSERAALYSRA